MNIGLIDVDSKIPNLALMKISAWHKRQGDQVNFYRPLFDNPQKIYASKIFDYTEDYQYFPRCQIEKGGIAYDVKKTLPSEIEQISPDYSLYSCNYAMGFTTRGCIRKCPWCIVPQKEGNFKIVGDIYDFWNGQEKIMLLDNNLTADNEHFERILKQLIKERIKVDFSQGLDIRLIDNDKAKLLSQVKYWKQLRFAWDEIKIEKAVMKGIQILKKNNISMNRLMFYVLVGFNSTFEEDYYRVMTLKKMKIDPFVMIYNKKGDRFLKEFARWNNRFYFRNLSFKDYLKARKVKMRHLDVIQKESIVVLIPPLRCL